MSKGLLCLDLINVGYAYEETSLETYSFDLNIYKFRCMHILAVSLDIGQLKKATETSSIVQLESFGSLASPEHYHHYEES